VYAWWKLLEDKSGAVPAPQVTLYFHIIFPLSCPSVRILACDLTGCNMADALKAEGNKAFAAKNFTEAVYVCPLSMPDSH